MLCIPRTSNFSLHFNNHIPESQHFARNVAVSNLEGLRKHTEGDYL